MSSNLDIDAFVALAIESLFPNHEKPDENNFNVDGSNYKAPDHALYGGAVLVERKTRNADIQKIIAKSIENISRQQNFTVNFMGQVPLAKIIKQYPNPDQANRQISDAIYDGILQSLRDANDKFRKYTSIIQKNDQLKIAIVSDNSAEMTSILSTSFFIWRKMGAEGNERDKLPFLDCVIIIRNPLYTVDCSDGYWFEVLLRDRTDSLGKSYAYDFVKYLHGYISNCTELRESVSKFTKSSLVIQLIK